MLFRVESDTASFSTTTANTYTSKQKWNLAITIAKMLHVFDNTVTNYQNH